MLYSTLQEPNLTPVPVLSLIQTVRGVNLTLRFSCVDNVLIDTIGSRETILFYFSYFWFIVIIIMLDTSVNLTLRFGVQFCVQLSVRLGRI